MASKSLGGIAGRYLLKSNRRILYGWGYYLAASNTGWQREDIPIGPYSPIGLSSARAELS